VSTNDPRSLPVGPTEKGKWNVCVGFLGKPGAGKTEGAVRYALDLSRKPGCYIVCHDNGWRVPESLHDGRATGVRRHEQTADAVASLGNPKTARGIHCVPSDDAEEVISIAEAVAEASLEAHGGSCGYPSLVFLDEVVAAGVCRPNYLSPSMQHLLTLRRHKNVGVVWTCQTARMVHNQLLTLATELYIFRLTDRRDFDRLEEAGIPPDCIVAIGKLPPYKCIRVNMGNPEEWEVMK